MTQKMINEIGYKIVGCAIEVHKHLGPGLLESVYHPCILEEIRNMGMKAEPEIWIPISYKGKNLGGKLKLDCLVEDMVVVEFKAVDVMIPLYEAQLLSYLKLADKPKGLLINFHSATITSQVVSLVTEKFALYPKE